MATPAFPAAPVYFLHSSFSLGRPFKARGWCYGALWGCRSLFLDLYRVASSSFFAVFSPASSASTLAFFLGCFQPFSHVLATLFLVGSISLVWLRGVVFCESSSVTYSPGFFAGPVACLSLNMLAWIWGLGV